jgi:hypothetical protein
VDSVTVEQALRQLRLSAGVSLLYSPDLLPVDKRVSCACERVTVREALEKILAGTGLTFRAAGAQIRIVPNPRTNGAASMTTGFIAGRVLAVDTGEPVVNAMVRLESAQGVPAGAGGSFVIRDVAPGRLVRRPADAHNPAGHLCLRHGSSTPRVPACPSPSTPAGARVTHPSAIRCHVSVDSRVPASRWGLPTTNP